MNDNLIPTPIVDVNGKQTTVHKSSHSNAASSAVLATSRPSVSAAPKKKERTATVDWMMAQLPVGEGFIWDMGTGLGEHRKGIGVDPAGGRFGVGGGYSTMTMKELFGFMRHGATFYEAARLIEFKPLGDWEHDEDFQRASEQNRTKFEKVLDLVGSKDMKIGDVFKLLGNGITDELLDSSTLTNDQTLSIFSRFKYSHYTASKTANETPAMINALLNGSLPYAVFDGGYDKTNVTKMVKELYGNPGKKAELTEDEREALKASPEDITMVLDLIAHQKPFTSYSAPFRSIGITYRAFKEFGEQAVRGIRPEILVSTLRDGSYVGIEGANTAYSFMRYCNERTSLICSHHDVLRFSATVGPKDLVGLSVSLPDIVDMSNAGITEPAILHLIMNLGMSVDEAIETAKNSPSPILLEGAL